MNKYVSSIKIDDNSYDTTFSSFLKKFFQHAEKHNINIFEAVKDSVFMFAVRENDCVDTIKAFGKFLEKHENDGYFPEEFTGYKFRNNNVDGVLFVSIGLSIEHLGCLCSSLMTASDNVKIKLYELEYENDELKERIKKLVSDNELCSVKNAELHLETEKLKSFNDLEMLVTKVYTILSKHEDVLRDAKKVELYSVDTIKIYRECETVELKFSIKETGCVIQVVSDNGFRAAHWYELKGEKTYEGLVEHIVREILCIHESVNVR